MGVWSGEEPSAAFAGRDVLMSSHFLRIQNLTQNVNPQPSGTSNIDVSFDVEPGCDE